MNWPPAKEEVVGGGGGGKMTTKHFFLSFYYRLELVPVSFAAARAGVTQFSPTPRLRRRLYYYEDRLHSPKVRRTKTDI